MIRVPRKSGAREDQMMQPWELLAENRILHLIGFIVGAWGKIGRYDYSSPEAIAQSMIILDSLNHKPIKLVIDSPGGIIQDGLRFYNIMQSLKSPVYTIGSFCASMAAILFVAGTPGHRYLYPHARIMLHLPTAEVTGDVETIQRQTAEFQKDKEILVNLLMKHGCKKSRKKILEDIDREFYLSDQGAINYGVADYIITPDIHQELFGNLVIPDFKQAEKSKCSNET